MALQGNIDSFPLVDVLGLLSGSHKTGRLVVNADRCQSTLWLAEGDIVGATSAAPGTTPGSVGPAEALFDLLRCGEGAFYFENDLECSDPAEPVAAEVAIEAAQAALTEWFEITAVIPGLTSPLMLQTALTDDEVTLDGRLWGGLVVLVSVAVRDEGVVNACAFVECLGLGELDALRLAYDLVGRGLIELAPLPDPVPEPTRSADPAPPEFTGVAVAGVPSVSLPAPGSNEVVHPALAVPPAFEVVTPAVAPAMGAGVGGLQPPAAPRNLAAAAQEDSEAELARQLAMLSPRAAEAVAGADATAAIDDADAPRVARFFDTA